MKNGTTLPDEVRAGTWVVIAAYNEGSSLSRVVRTVREQFPNVVVVDDGSADSTADTARGCATWVLRHPANRGQGAALQTGIQFALSRGARFVVTFDADGQHQVDDISALVTPIWKGECDITLGSRFIGQTVDMPRSRRLLLSAAVLFTRHVNGLRVTDAHNGLRAFSRRAARRIRIGADRMAHASELLDIIRSMALPFQEVPVHVQYTEYSLAKGQSPLGAAKILVHYMMGRLFPVTLFQLILLAVLAVFALVTLLGGLRGAVTRRWALTLEMLWLCGVVAVIWPEATSQIARLFGIGRGADLILYCALVVMVVGFFVVYVRLRRLRSRITVLVREMAIMQAEGPFPVPGPGPEPSATTVDGLEGNGEVPVGAARHR